MIAAALALLVSFLLVAMQSPSAEAAPGLRVSPESGSPGDSVTASAIGFEDCVSYVYGGSGDGSDEGESSLEAGTVPGTVTFAWDDTDLSSQPLTDGGARATFLVPEGTSLREHSISATCDQDRELAVSLSFPVAPPTPMTVPVPDIVGKSLPEARATLGASQLTVGDLVGTGAIVQRQSPAAHTIVPVGTPVDIFRGTPPPVPVGVPKVTGLTVAKAAQRLARAGLTLGSTSSHGEIVIAQSPQAFTRVKRGSAVDVTLGPVVPLRVRVPDLIGSKVADAPRVLASRGLSLGRVSGHGDVVRSQRPAAGTLVPRRTTVALSVEAGVRPPQLVAVPNLVGKSLSAAERALARVELLLGTPTTGGHGLVVKQEPAAGVLVPRRTVVTVSEDGVFGLPVPPTPSPTPALTPTPTSTDSASGPTTMPTQSLTPGPTPTSTQAVDPASGPPKISLPTLVLLVVAGAAVLLGGAAAAQHVVRGRRSLAWVHGHVRAVPGGMPLDRPRAEVREGGPRDKDVAIRIEPQPDSGTHLLEESRP